MSRDIDPLATPRLRAAVTEVQDLIRARYPTTTFSVWAGLGDDRDGIYIEAAVDTDDLSEVVDIYGDRLVDFHLDEGLPLHVIPVYPTGRTEANGGRRSGTNRSPRSK